MIVIAVAVGLEELALFGGSPAFSEPLLVGRPNVGNRERCIQRLVEILDSRWLTNRGPFVEEFERRVALITGVKHCIAMCNGTVALEILIRALGLRGEVIIPSFTFIATAHALQWQQITPVFCDIDPQSHNINPEQIESLITSRTTGIIGVHVWGRSCDVEGLEKTAKRRGLQLIFDAAHAFGCSHRGRMIGGFGLAEVFSFHATKFINCFEGGAVVTNDGVLAEKIRLMQNFGFTWTDCVDYIGTNGKMSEISAAMGLTSLESMDDVIELNRRNYDAYHQELSTVPGLQVFKYDETERNNYQYVVIEVDETVVGLCRDDLIAVLLAENVRARRYFYPGCHSMEPYRSLFPHARLLLPETETLARRVMLLPTGTAVNREAIGSICAILRTAVDNAAAVRERLVQADPD